MHTTAHPATFGAWEKRPASRSLLDRLLGVFADVRPGEGVTAVLLMLNVFLLLAAYYLLKTIREPLILSVPGGAEIKSYSAAATAALLMVVVPVYGGIASRVSRVRLINGVTLFFIACLVAFFALSRLGVPVGVAFFVWVGIFNLVIIAQLWSFANDVYTVDQGERLFAIVGFGASMGAIAGAFATGKLVSALGITPFMLGAAALLGVCMALTNVINARERGRAGAAPGVPRGGAASAAGERISGRGGFALVFSRRYLMMIAGLMLVYNLVNTNGEYILGKTLVAAYQASHGAGSVGSVDEKQVIGEFYGNFFTWVNIVSAVIQALIVSRVIKYFGIRAALLVLPVLALAGYASMALLPLLPLIRGVKLAENSVDYSLQNTTRNALYLPTGRDAKYKAKQANDTFFVRLGDVLSAGVVFAGTTWLGFAPHQFAYVNVALIVVWLVLAIAIGRTFHRLARAPAVS